MTHLDAVTTASRAATSVGFLRPRPPSTHTHTHTHTLTGGANLDRNRRRRERLGENRDPEGRSSMTSPGGISRTAHWSIPPPRRSTPTARRRAPQTASLPSFSTGFPAPCLRVAPAVPSFYRVSSFLAFPSASTGARLDQFGREGGSARARAGLLE